MSSDYTVNRSRVTTERKAPRTHQGESITAFERSARTLDEIEYEADRAPVESESTEDLLVNRLIINAEELIGTKYRYGGTSPERGFDCSGFTSCVFASQDIQLPRTSTDQSRMGKRIPFEDAREGDLVFFGTGSRVNHVGLVVSKRGHSLEVIHSTSSNGVRKDDVNSSTYWRSRRLWAISMPRK